MGNRIDKIYFITHPAYTTAIRSKETRNTPNEIRHFIETELHPVIERAAKEPNSIVVLVKSPFSLPIKGLSREIQSAMRRSLKISGSWHRKGNAVEKRFAKFVEGKLGVKAIISSGHVGLKALSKDPADLIIEKVKAEIKRRKFELSRNASVEGYGSYREICAHDFPNKFREALGITGRFEVKRAGSISFVTGYRKLPRPPHNQPKKPKQHGIRRR